MEDIRLERAIMLFNEIKSLYPNNSVRLSIFDIDFTILKDGWQINEIGSKKLGTFRTARRDGIGYDITLYEKDNE